jgi:hypothetical protein
MTRSRGGWINFLGGLVGTAMLVAGSIGLRAGFGMADSFIAVLGFLIAGWAVLDYRRYRRGTPESEVDGGHTIE